MGERAGEGGGWADEAAAFERLRDEHRQWQRELPEVVAHGPGWSPLPPPWAASLREAWVAGDASGRIGQLRRSLPGLYPLALALHALGGPMREASQRLLDQVVAGRKPAALVREGLEAFAPRAVAWGLWPGTAASYVEAQLPRVRRMAYRVSPHLALAPIRAPHAVDDVPSRFWPAGNARWFAVMEALPALMQPGGPEADTLRVGFARWASRWSSWLPGPMVRPRATLPDAWRLVLAERWHLPRATPLLDVLAVAAGDRDGARLRPPRRVLPGAVDRAILPALEAPASRVEAILTARRLAEEGAALGHCAHALWAKVADGALSVYALEAGGARATLALERDGDGAVVVHDFAGPANAPPDAALVALARAWLCGHGVELDRVWCRRPLPARARGRS